MRVSANLQRTELGEKAAKNGSPPKAGSDPKATSLLSVTLTPEQVQALDDAALSVTLRPAAASDAALDHTMIGAASLSSSSGVAAFPVANWERYEFIDHLGQGGMGAVYKARDKRLNRIVALKFIRGGDLGMVQRFMQEARAQARITHPGICKVYETGEVQGHAYIAMQYIEGQSLDRAAASLTLAEKVQLLRKVAEAIHEAHQLGIIHRDIKPSNIMLERAADGILSPVVMDFGLARESTEGKGLTESGAVLGTPGYMAPEQARGETRNIDRRSDVYSLGATLYTVLAGVGPFEAESVVSILLKVMDEEPKPLRQVVPTIPVNLETITMRCLQKERAARYDTAKALADDLGRYLEGTQVVARPISLLTILRRRARKHKALVALGAALFVSLLGLLGYGIRTRLAAIERERQAKAQAELLQRLGQEVTKMEWLLQAARELPLHDLEREKVIVRGKMELLQQELANYGDRARGLAHYALGRGHVALHEYPQALLELRKAIDLGVQTAEVQYALGLVLGKHYEQAMYEARLSGGGDWAKKQLKEIEPMYLTPAVVALEQSRAVKLDAPEYLEGLIAYYKRDYELAVKKSEAALKQAPWLYEARKLAGDVHLEQALQARDGGRLSDAALHFSLAVKSYEAAAEIGRSDGEVYEGLAEAWVRQVEMAVNQGKPSEPAYTSAISSIEKLSTAEPTSIAGPLKKAFASLMTMALGGAGLASEERLRQCLISAQKILDMQPGHPYASEVAADCSNFAADSARVNGRDPEPLLRKALNILEPTVKKYPHFLWGLNDLGGLYTVLGTHQQLHGSFEAKKTLQKAIEYFSEASALDPTYMSAKRNGLGGLALLIPEIRSESELKSILSASDNWFSKCISADKTDRLCFNNYFQIYARAAERVFRAGDDSHPFLNRGLQSLADMRRLGPSDLDGEQYAALLHLVESSERVRLKQDPAPALLQMQAELNRCYKLAPNDAMCRTIDAQGEWVTSKWLSIQGRSMEQSLHQALLKAELATKSPEPYPDAWQVLAETHLQIARAELLRPQVREQHLSAGLAAAEKIFAINPNHALGYATQGALLLLRAQTQREPSGRAAVAETAQKALQRALENDPFLQQNYAPLLHQAEELAQAHTSPDFRAPAGMSAAN